MLAELILIGGASVLINYGFRNMTTDIDAVIEASSLMKEAINHVGDLYGLPNGWLNADFTKTVSYSEKLSQFSVYYKTYANVVTIRTIKAEYLIAMKLRSCRQYKSDLLLISKTCLLYIFIKKYISFLLVYFCQPVSKRKCNHPFINVHLLIRN